MHPMQEALHILLDHGQEAWEKCVFGGNKLEEEKLTNKQFGTPLKRK